jgi:hypothetical protein
MKFIATLSVCLFMSGAMMAQTAPAKVKKAKSDKDKTVIYGTLKDARNKPYKGMKAFVYKADSTIIASGFTDADGHFETNNVPAGTYFVKLIYPTDKVTMVYNVEVKKSVPLDLKGAPPAEDTMIAYDVLYPKTKPAAKK